MWNTWAHEGRQILMVKGPHRISRRRAELEWIGRGRMAPCMDHIEQLVVTLPCHATKQSIGNIAHRIDKNTTICLVQDGLGMVEELNEAFFQDPDTRPAYILGHMTASLGFYRPAFFSTLFRKPGKLLLTAVEPGISNYFSQFSLRSRSALPEQRQAKSTQFLRTLVSTEGLGAGGFRMEDFLMKKLPAMVFQCIIEPIAIALDTTYDQVLRNDKAILLADELLEELFNVIWALPELSNSSKVLRYCGMDALRRFTLTRLTSKGAAQSQMLSLVRIGKMVDIDYLNGYFVKRGEELGIKTPQNKMVIDLVKARVEARRKEIKGLIPFEGVDPSPESSQ